MTFTTWTDYRSPLDQESRNRRARLMRGARKSERRGPFHLMHWTDLPLLAALVLAGVLALVSCETPTEPFSGPVTSDSTVTVGTTR